MKQQIIYSSKPIYIQGVSIGNDEKKDSNKKLFFHQHPDSPLEDKLYCEENPYIEEEE